MRYREYAAAASNAGSRRKILRSLYVGLVTVAAASVAAPAAAAPPLRAQTAVVAPQCTAPPEPQPEIVEVPWAQRWFQPDRVWSMSRGSGVVVAVIDTGVDAQHPQLRGSKVREGFDLVTNTTGGNGDCDSHGTAVTSIVAAQAAPGIGFTGLAPAATILPLRVAERGVAPDDASEAVDPDRLATAVRQAVDGGARVINVSVVFFVDHPAVAAAIRYAQGRGAIVVAAVGNHHDPAAPGPDAVPYPAAYPAVIGVGAIAENGTLVPTSYVGPHVDLVAPGSAVVAAVRGSGHAHWTGTSFAAPFVSAAAALVIAADRGRSGAEVVRLLLATADPPAGGLGYGHGVVNPYRALTERVVDGQPVTAEPLPATTPDPAAVARSRQWHRTAAVAAIVSVVMVGLALSVAAMVATRRRSRGRPREHIQVSAPIENPEREFFTVPGTRENVRL